MTTISFGFPDEFVPRIVTAFTGSYGYSPTLPDGKDNPEPPDVFARRKVVDYVKEVVTAYEVGAARQAAGDTAAAAVTKEIDAAEVTITATQTE